MPYLKILQFYHVLKKVVLWECSVPHCGLELPNVVGGGLLFAAAGPPTRRVNNSQIRNSGRSSFGRRVERMELSRQWRRRFQKSTTVQLRIRLLSLSISIAVRSFFLSFRRFASKLSRGEAGALRPIQQQGAAVIRQRGFVKVPFDISALVRRSLELCHNENTQFSRGKNRARPDPLH